MKRAHDVIKPILHWFNNSTGPILDFGSGLGHIGYIISQESKREVTYLDVRKYPFTCPQINVEVFDGLEIPYPDKHFDSSIIVFVLHHTPNPQSSLEEVVRVTKRNIFICEDLLISEKDIKKEIIKDTIANGFLPHMTLQYKIEKDWEKLFIDMGLSIEEKVHYDSKFIFNFKHVSWMLKINP